MMGLVPDRLVAVGAVHQACERQRIQENLAEASEQLESAKLKAEALGAHRLMRELWNVERAINRAQRRVEESDGR